MLSLIQGSDGSDVQTTSKGTQIACVLGVPYLTFQQAEEKSSSCPI